MCPGGAFGLNVGAQWARNGVYDGLSDQRAKGVFVLFAPFDDQETFELWINPDPLFNYVPKPGDKPQKVEDAMNTLRLWDYLRTHAADPVVNAGAIAHEFGWPRAAVFHYLIFLIVGRAVECNRSRELVRAIDRIRPEMNRWLKEHGVRIL